LALARELLMSRDMDQRRDQQRDPQRDPRQESTSNPHDKLFKAVFGRAANAADLLRALLPASVIDTLDIATLSAEPTSTVDASLRERFSDLLYSAAFHDHDSRLFIILEHKSRPGRLTALEAARYAIDVATAQVKEHGPGRGLPLVLAVVIHHGKGGWNAPRALYELCNGPASVREALRGYVLEGGFLLYDVARDVARDSDAILRQRGMNPLATLALWVLARARSSDDMAAELGRVIDLFQQVLARPEGLDDVLMLVRYILTVCDISFESLETVLLGALGQRVTEACMTGAERLRQEGLEQGLEQGLKQGRQSFLLMQLQTRFGALPDDVIERVNAADAEALDTWGRRVLTAGNLAEVLAQDHARS
jgi:predicted transposase YdaD